MHAHLHTVHVQCIYSHAYHRLECVCVHADAGDGQEEEEEEESGNLSKKRKPWGDTSYFCPVALSERGVLWPGSEEHALRYMYMYMYIHVQCIYMYMYMYCT